MKPIVSIGGMILLLGVLVLPFQNCGPQMGACGTSGATDDSTNDASSTSEDCTSLSQGSTSENNTLSDGTTLDSSSPFSSTYSGNTSSSSSFTGNTSTGSGGSRTGDSDDSASSDGVTIARNCTSSGCPSSYGFTFQYLPEAISINEGEYASMRSGATNASGTVTYQWYKDGVLLSGQTNPYITFYPTQMSQTGNYHVVARDGGSGKTISTTPVKLTVKEVIINCGVAIYGYSSIVLSSIMIGLPPEADQYNPPGHKYFLSTNPDMPHGQPIGYSSSTDMGTVLFTPDAMVAEGNLAALTCAQYRGSSAKAADALGIPRCGWPANILVGDVSLKCVDGKFEIIGKDCSCTCSNPNPDGTCTYDY